MNWGTLIATNVISGLIVWKITIYYQNRKRQKSEKEDLYLKLKILSGELAGNLKGRGDNKNPFQVAYLKEILQITTFEEKYPELHILAIQCYTMSAGKQGQRPAGVQVKMGELYNSIKSLLETDKNSTM